MLKVPGDTSDKVFDWLSDQIVRGEIAPGEKLNEPKIAKQLSISRGPIREAIRRLEEKRLAVRTPQQGARVLVPTEKGLLELFTLREALEGMAAREAARNIRPDEIAELQRIIASAPERSTSENPAAPDFHIYVARIARNDMLFNLLCVDYYKLLLFYRRKYNLIFHKPQNVQKEHERIADAIADRDADLAEMLMRRHIWSAKEKLLGEIETLSR